MFIQEDTVCHVKVKAVKDPHCMSLLVYRWYFGKLTMRDAEKLLQSHDPGAYLVRDSGFVDKQGCYVISLR